jgi:hypothetical protein
MTTFCPGTTTPLSRKYVPWEKLNPLPGWIEVMP